MYKIRHIAIRAADQKKVVQFYKDTFGLQEVRNDGDGRAMYLSDGYLTLAILPGREGHKEGVDHFGFQVDDIDRSDAARPPALDAGELDHEPVGSRAGTGDADLIPLEIVKGFYR